MAGVAEGDSDAVDDALSVPEELLEVRRAQVLASRLPTPLAVALLHVEGDELLAMLHDDVGRLVFFFAPSGVCRKESSRRKKYFFSLHGDDYIKWKNPEGVFKRRRERDDVEYFTV